MMYQRILCRLTVPAAAILLLSPPRAVAQTPSPLGRATFAVTGLGGENFSAGRHGSAQFTALTIESGKFLSRRIEIGVEVNPWISVIQPVHDNGDGGYQTVGAFAADAYGRWYPAPLFWRCQPYVEIAEGPFYAVRHVPAAGSRFNFLTQDGAGLSVPLGAHDPWQVVAGYRWFHISNGGTYRRNPSWNFWAATVGFRKYIGR